MKGICILLITVFLLGGIAGCGSTPSQYTLTISSSAGGSVAAPGEGIFACDAGEVVNLVAIPDTSYPFIEWTGDVGTIANVYGASTTITMNGDYSINANFVLEIYDWHGLNDVRDNLSGNCLLMNNLDSTIAGYEELASPTANGGKGWQPIGYKYWNGHEYVEAGFEGTFDGQGHEIHDLYVNRPDESLVGIFSYVADSGVTKNIGVVNAIVTGGNLSVGCLVGENRGIVSNSYSSGNVNGIDTIGGLVGENWGTVSESYSTASVSGLFDVGGLVGYNCIILSDSYANGEVCGIGAVGGLAGGNQGIVSDSCATGNVTGEHIVGGLLGWNSGDTIVSDSYSATTVTGNYYVGGLVGQSAGNISNSYSTGSVAGEWGVGGMVGNMYDGMLRDSYSTGSVTGSSDVGGLVGCDDVEGYSEGTVTNSFWDIETSGQSASAGGTGKNTTEMQDIDTFSGATWDIVVVANPGIRNTSYIWNIVDDVTYPFLSWES